MAGLAALIWSMAPEAAAEACVPDRSLAGIDVSSYQGAIDWQRVREAGIVFAFARVSDGLAVIDQRFAENFVAMKKAGLRRGAYQYFRASVDPIAQADLMVAAVRRLGLPDLPLVADVETADGMPPEEVRARLALWLRRVERRTQRRPIVYTSPSMSELLGGDFGHHPLWVAHYDVECPSIPSGWQRWTYWQYSSSGRVVGVAGPVDLDVFAGTLAQLRRLNRRIPRAPSRSATGSVAGARPLPPTPQ
jgi:lysozyme